MMMSVIKPAKQRLDERQAELNHSAKKSLGQNFLISDHVIQKIIEATQSLNPKKIVEIGPGLGALTDLLIKLPSSYQCIEMDKGLFEYWKAKDIVIHNMDALKFDWSNIDSDILVSNLPYQISSSIVIDRSMDEKPLDGMVLMFQKEVAQRIKAQPRTSDYGMLTVIAQEFWSIENVCDAGPKDFLPAPKVASRVLKFVSKNSVIKFKKDYLSFVKRCFAQRRRILKSNLSKQEAEKLMVWVAENKLSDKVRAEELSPTQIRNLYLYLKS